MLIPVTVIVLTFNESCNIIRCLRALRSFGDLVVVDSGSTDGTVNLTSVECPHVRIYHNPFVDFGQQRNWAIDNVEPKYDWILFVDADEFMEDPLANEIAQFVAEPGEFCGGFIAGRNYFLDRWLKYSTFFPSYQLRLLKRGEVRFQKEGHGQREISGGTMRYFRSSWRHENLSQGVSHWVERHNRYSTDEIDLMLRLRSERLSLIKLFSRDPITRRRALKVLAAKLPCRAFNRVLYTYLIRFGFLDGRAGLIYAKLRLSHELIIDAKLAEARQKHLNAT